MIGFGELRKKAAAWQMELGAVEKIHATDWLLYGIGERAALREHLTLRGAAALANAYFENYPRVADLEFARAANLDERLLENELDAALRIAAHASGLQFKLHSFRAFRARIEFTSPLGRRSAAQPLLEARLNAAPPRLEPPLRALRHPFAETYAAAMRVVALDELAAELLVLYARRPRARDVFDLWFILTHGADALDAAHAFALAQRIAAEKKIALRTSLDETHAALLENTWAQVLKEIRPHPDLATARRVIETLLQTQASPP
ncbi:MAG: hypothetical protein HDKAJFGB_01666 [Anaerolineae bacterium]|nr:hypothetical protein [Anaerolineae bacterium]